jgi:16S rRNA (adenine1518-N6/adenine1519-N6)-dimethyltransferase
MKSIKPLKRFGQNYLHDQNIVNKIVAEINPLPDDYIVEIGPGLGALTSKLLLLSNLTAVEIDLRAAEILRKKFPELRLVERDFLKFELESLVADSQKLRIVGNIPYNLTSSIIFKMIRSHRIIKDSVLMVQYEVARRMTASKGIKDYGILSVLLTRFCEIRLAFKVPPAAFYPKPNVESAVVHLEFKKINSSAAEDEIFISVVKAAFGNRRKKLKNSLSNSIFKDMNFTESGIDLSLRAEQLEIKDFLILTDFVRNSNILTQNPGG